ncbi:MAG: hypothetical protein OXU61_04560 [Gammaproteobacteria bacterium]|nr:hypothetical protein [Gammaproteobacteria bacterium]
MVGALCAGRRIRIRENSAGVARVGGGLPFACNPVGRVAVAGSVAVVGSRSAAPEPAGLAVGFP